MSSRPPVFTWNEELHFGPPSEPITIQTFVNQAQNLHSNGLYPWLDSGSTETGDAEACSAIAGWQEWQQLPEEIRATIELDCDVDDIKDSLFSILSSQKHMSYLQGIHAAAVTELAVPPHSGKKTKGKSKKSAAERNDADLEPFKKTVEQAPLRIWKLKSAAKPYIRPGHISDQNALDTLRLKNARPPDVPLPLSHEVLVTLTTYTRNTWYPYAFSRDSQHVLPSLNTLGDVWNCIPCALKSDGSMPKEISEIDVQHDLFGHFAGPSKGRVLSFSLGDNEPDQDSVVMVVEGTAYSDGRGKPDYADKLISHLGAFKPPLPDPEPLLPPGPYERPKSSTPLQKGPSIDIVPLRSLTLRVNEPYWVLHRGNCEHWVVVDEIRLQNPRDPASGYPIALQRTPVLRPLCRVCSKVPATLSVINDVRLGESPGMLCKPCWELFGGPPQPKEGDDPDARVVVVPVVFETS